MIKTFFMKRQYKREYKRWVRAYIIWSEGDADRQGEGYDLLALQRDKSISLYNEIQARTT